MTEVEPAELAVVLVDTDDHPLSPVTFDAVLEAGDGAEVIVVDARQTPGRAWAGRAGPSVVPAGTKRGTGLRILGYEASTAPLVAFLDARAVPEQGWIASGKAALAADPSVVAVTGSSAAGEPTLSLTGAIGALHPVNPRAPHQVLYPHPEFAVVRRDLVDAAGGFESLLSWPGAMVELGWRTTLLGWRSVLDPAIRVDTPCTCSGDVLDGLTTLYTCLGDDLLRVVLPAAMTLTAQLATQAAPDGAASVVDEFLARSQHLQARRDRVQGTRVVDDDSIVPLFIAPLEPGRGERGLETMYRQLVDRTGLRRLLPSRCRILIVTPDILRPRMAGPAIRAWHIADALADRHVVALASTSGTCEIESPRFEALAPDDSGLRRRARDVDVILVQGFAMEGRPYLRAEDKVVVVDLYDPLHLEQLELFRFDNDEKRRVTVQEATRVLNEQLVRGDFLVCASEKQRDFWLGQLSGLGRVNFRNYDEDTRLRRLLDVVPFGLPDEEPVASGPGARGVISGIGPDDDLVLWGGGIYNWFDPLTLIRAVDALREQLPRLRLLFMGLRHPNPEVSEMQIATQARLLASELRVTDQLVFFNEGWVPYHIRQNYLLEASVGVSTHFDHIETEFSFRTRILDYIWTLLPIVTTTGDSFAELVDREGLGIAVPPCDVDALAAALLRTLRDEGFAASCRTNLARVREAFRWSRVLKPITEFCDAPQRAADLSDSQTRGTLWAPDADRFDDWLRHQPTTFQRLRHVFADL